MLRELTQPPLVFLFIAPKTTHVFRNQRYKRLGNMEIILKWPSNPINSSNLLLSWSPPHLQVSQREFQVQKARWRSFERPKHDTTTRLAGLTQALISHHWGPDSKNHYPVHPYPSKCCKFHFWEPVLVNVWGKHAPKYTRTRWDPQLKLILLCNLEQMLNRLTNYCMIRTLTCLGLLD